MSRVGKMPIAVPKGVDVAITADQITVKGSGGSLTRTLNALVTIKNNAGTLSFAPANDSTEADAMSGTMRALVNNMINGVGKGFEKKLSLVGVGFRAHCVSFGPWPGIRSRQDGRCARSLKPPRPGWGRENHRLCPLIT